MLLLVRLNNDDVLKCDEIIEKLNSEKLKIKSNGKIIANKIIHESKKDNENKSTITDNTELEELKKEYFCVKCFKGKRNYTFMPCAHLAICHNCRTMFEICPICKSKIDSVIKCYSI